MLQFWKLTIPDQMKTPPPCQTKASVRTPWGRWDGYTSLWHVHPVVGQSTSHHCAHDTRQTCQQSIPSGGVGVVTGLCCAYSLSLTESSDVSQSNRISKYPNGALGWLHAASTYASRRIGVDVAVLEVDRASGYKNTTALPNKSKCENPMGAMG